MANSSSKKALYLISLVHAANDSSISVVPALFPLILLEYNVNLFEIGILVAAGYFATIVGQPITGRLAEKYSPKNLLAAGIGVITASMVLLIFSFNFDLLLGSFVLLRAGSSVYHPVGASAVSRRYPGSMLDSSMGFQSAFGNFGIFVAFIVSAPLHLLLGPNAPFEIYGAFCFAVSLITFFMLEKISDTPVLEEQRGVQNVRAKNRFHVNLPLFFLVSTLISGAAYSVIFNYGNVLLDRNGFPPAEADFLIAFWIGISFIGAFYTGALTRIFKRYRLISISYFVASASTLAFSLFPGSVVIVVPSLLLGGLGISITYPAIYAGVASYLGSLGQRTGPSFGVLFSAQLVGSAVMGFLSGYISQLFGLVLPFEIAAGILLLGCFASLVWQGHGPS